MNLHLPRGFLFAGVHAGIKRNPNKEDVTLVHCPAGAAAAGVYTTNRVFAAPVALDRQRTPAAGMRVVVANSGNANACTGVQGDEDARTMARLAAAAVGAREEQALVMSTGIIGHFLPMDKIAAGITAAAARLAADEASFLAAARGILTTDKGIKIASRAIGLSAGTVHLAGMCKGAGMIGPKMATMLAILTTDAALTPAQAQELLTATVEESFNCISVEGHMSTNDTVLLLASGQAMSAPPAAGDLVALRAGLTDLCIELAKQIPDDGEGASHLIALDVRGLRTREEAHRIAATVANSALVKTAIAGGDPNWGRIVSAAGYADVPFDPGGVDVAINGHLLYERGTPVPFDARTVSEAIKSRRETQIVLTFREGTAAVRYWTSDLNVEYVRFNADYTT